jgi:hypothetical protein
MVEFANDFVDLAIERFGLEPWKRVTRLPHPLAVVELMAARPKDAGESVSERLLLSAALQPSQRMDLRDSAEQNGFLEESFTAGSIGTCLLGAGWSMPEEWGVWSIGHSAQLHLPIPEDDHPWVVLLTGHAFVGDGERQPSRLIFRLGTQVIAQLACGPAIASLAVEFLAPPPADAGSTILDIEAPDAVSPAQLGVSDDPRVLGIALTSIRLTRQSVAV